jgi:hypothetical protein
MVSPFRARTALPGAAVAGALASLVLLSCSGGSGGDPASPTQQVPATDTWVRATAELLNVGAPSGPEFYDCHTRLGIYAGVVWELVADRATAGATSIAPTQVRFNITATDDATRTGLVLGLAIDPATLTGQLLPTATSFTTDLTCTSIDGRPESSFAANNPPVPTWVVTIDSAETAAGSLVLAEPVGATGAFSPTGIVEGSFSFFAANLQSTPSGTVSAEILVTGCFRVNLPATTQGVPVRAATCS